MAEVKWIKIVTDIFDDEKMLLIKALPESDAITVVWFKLLCLAGKQNNGGVFMMGHIPYTDEMMATIFRKPLNTVRLALSTFEQFGMAEIVNNTITIPNWGKHQNLEGIESAREKTRMRVAAYRERQKALPSGNVTDHNSNVTVTHTDKEIDKDIDKEREIKNKSGKAAKQPRHKYGEYNNVLLSDADMEKLKAEYPGEWEQLIERLSSYIVSSGKTYKNHLATIRNWKRRDKEKVGNNNGTGINGNYYSGNNAKPKHNPEALGTV